MNSKHRDTASSARMHLFQKLWTLGQQLAHPLVLRLYVGE
jgi:hypothetical protein